MMPDRRRFQQNRMFLNLMAAPIRSIYFPKLVYVAAEPMLVFVQTLLYTSRTQGVFGLPMRLLLVTFGCGELSIASLSALLYDSTKLLAITGHTD